MARETLKIEGFKRKFAEIRNKQFKPQGRGYGSVETTLISLIGLGMDNKKAGDLGFAELKVRMKGAAAPIKLFSFDKDSWQIEKSDEIHKFGNDNEQGGKRLRFEMRQGAITKTGLQFFCNDEKIAVLSPVGDVIGEWTLDTLINTFTNKIKNLVLVNAETTLGPGGYDYFVYRTAAYLHGFSKGSIRAAFLNNVIILNTNIDSIELKSNGAWRVKNRGTSFRINEAHLEDIFEHRDFL